MAPKAKKAIEYALILRPEEIEALTKIRGSQDREAIRAFEKTYAQWNGWSRHFWPADVVIPGTQFLAFDSKSRKFVAILEVSKGESFVFKTGSAFARAVERITGHTAAVVRRDPQYEIISARATGDPCTGFAFCNRFVERIDVPFDGHFHQIGWLRDLGELGIAPRSRGKRAETTPQATTLTDLVRTWDGRDTTRRAEIEARIGQGAFRRRLFNIWGACVLTGVRTIDVLRASHIKPWRDCLPQERVDPANGILLSATFDALFDAGWISLTDAGGLLVSPRLSASERVSLGLDQRFPAVRFAKRQLKYLKYHRTHIFRAN